MLQKQRLLMSSRLQKSLKRKSFRKRLIRYSLVSANLLVLVAVVLFVVGGSHGSDRPLATASAAASGTDAANPVDGLTSYDIAANVAHMVDLPESTAIDNQAQSARISAAVSTSSTGVVSKPQIVATALKSKDDIRSYTVQSGDTVTSVAQKFGVTTNSIKWSNNLVGDALTVGNKILVPPMNGIVYTAKAGDTVQSLATKYKVSADQIIAYNDAEIGGIHAGEQLLIPNGQIQTVTARYGGGSGAYSLSSYTPVYGGNGYAFGYCTWYVATRVNMPSNWGNANTWDNFAPLSGWTVSSTPRVGAIAQTDGSSYLGHVAYVESVNANGTVTISEMNGPAGWDRVDTRTVPVSSFRYIYH